MMQNLRPAGVLKRKRDEQQDEDRPYIKKPPNAFMLFLKEQRAKVKAELNINRNEAVNAAVGERWKSLSEDQQAKYYKQAEEERMLHAQQHPEWSPKDNYGKKKRVQRSTCSTASASKPVKEAQEAKWTSFNVPVCGTFQLPQVNQVLPASDANSHASTSLASYAGPSQPQTEAIFSDDTGEDLLSIPEHRDPLLPAPQPLEPVCHYSDPHTGPQGDQISPDSPPSTDVNLLYQRPVNGVPTAAAAAATVPLAAPSNTSSNVLRIPDRMMQNLRPAGVLKRKRDEQQDEDRPYIKKPPNAFMLFLKEQRAKVKAELNINRNEAVNAAVGERWKSLSEDQQAKYYKQAEEERMLHAQQHPEWSPKDNYGKKKRVQRSTCSTASASKPVKEAEEAKWTSFNVPVCGTFQLPQVNQVLPASDANSHASTSLASYAGPSQPQTEAIFSDDTGEDLLSIPEHRDPLLPAPQPLEPVCHYSDPHTGPQGDQISPDSPPSTDVNLLYQRPVNGVPTAAAAAATVPLAAPSNTSSNVLRIPDRMMQNLRPAGVLKRKRHEQQDEAQLYIKKPPNAFMLFLKEQRAKVKAELNINRNAAVNAAVGERWKSLSEDQQAKYYKQAEEERMLHAQQHPEWSPKDNYGKKKRVQRSTCSTCKRRF
ncbi:transcription factor 7-like 1-B [Archocentrus centrarchus]|uniref:transcription factor 7-like 1-B n=1 Tax=Archocentrus centrarchus TaxID=63155 RepID=UPI0011E9F6A6|nr:transcription factor 7-like 1-B [Archocentrus centrarchus]